MTATQECEGFVSCGLCIDRADLPPLDSRPGGVLLGEGSMPDVIGEHLAYLRHLERRPRSIDQRRRVLNAFARHRGDDLLTASYLDLVGFVSRGESRGPDARCAEISHLRGFYRWALDHELITTDPSARLRRPRRPRRLPRPMADNDLAAALSKAPEPIRSWLYLAAYGGLRCCEIAQIQGADYRPTQGLLLIPEQKGGDTGVISVAPVLAQVIDRWPTDGWWFPRWDGVDEPIAAGQLSRHGNRWLHRQGIMSTMHSLRHWHGTYVYRASGRDLRLTQEVMRHRSPVSTALYTLVDREEAGSVVSRLPTF